jgi:hypothetical protein
MAGELGKTPTRKTAKSAKMKPKRSTTIQPADCNQHKILSEK